MVSHRGSRGTRETSCSSLVPLVLCVRLLSYQFAGLNVQSPDDVIPKEPPTGASLHTEAWRRLRDLKRRMRHSRPCRARGFRSLGRRPGSGQVKTQRSGAARDDVFWGCTINLEKRYEIAVTGSSDARAAA